MASTILSSNTRSRPISQNADAQLEEHDQCSSIGVETDGSGYARETSRLTGKWRVGRMGGSRTGSGAYGEFNTTSAAVSLWPLELDELDLPTESRAYELGKRVFDVTLAILILPLIALMLLVIGLLIGLSSGWPVFYRQRRIGRHGKEFHIWKFRTMHLHGDRILRDHLKRNAAARLEWQHTHKLRNDPRVTSLGRFLRKTSLDELPQIFNVMNGEMSFVGPRPIVEAETAKYAERFTYYLAAVPGITGLWQVSGRCNVSYATRVILDETYVRKWSLGRDLWILMKTPKAVCCRHGAY